MNKELLYDNEKEYWLDVQLNTTECDKCGTDMDVMKSIPIKVSVKNGGTMKTYKGYPISNGLNWSEDGYIFVCSSCKKGLK